MINEGIVRLSSLLVGCVYPAFASYKILNGKSRSEREQNIWLSYWIAYGVYAIIEFFSVGLIWWVPFINEFKLFFLCWLLPTVGGGSELIYDDFLCPFFTRNESAIDQAITTISIKSGEILSELVQLLYSILVVIAEQCCIMRQNGDMHLTPSIEAALNEVLAGRQGTSASGTNNEQIEEQVAKLKEVARKVVKCRSLGELAKLKLSQKSQSLEKSTPQQPESESQVTSESKPGQHIDIKCSSEIELRILKAEAEVAQRIQLTNQMSNSEPFARANSHMLANTMTTFMGPVYQPVEKPQRPPKPKRGLRKQQGVNQELGRILHEQDGSINNPLPGNSNLIGTNLNISNTKCEL
ncbi:uncharacterized protein LOC115628883 [Scaptodrosophila lebanonensis]|uniref:Receptor expression-enhancing protein n=1 Tax=Drosophila lebanonensis TaxID=7225 RepID=A0A6J2TXZ4_DROLE|nr:uncharacterized protein LOC115628883 [Scaptodrosophila lebanonensis]